MRKFKVSLAAMALAATGIVSNADAALTDINWIGGTGSKNWQDTVNWQGGVFPNDPTTDLHRAVLSVNLGSNLSVDLGITDISVARLSIGSMSNPVTTTINSSTSGNASRLLFQNRDPEQPSATESADFNTNTRITGRDFLIWQRGFGRTGDDVNEYGDANYNDVVDGADLPIWQAQYGLGSGIFNIGAPGIESTGIAGVTNTIESPIHIVNQRLEIGGSRDLTLNGAMTFEGNPTNDIPNLSNSGVQVVTSTQTVTMNGNIAVFDSDAVVDAVNYDFRINDNNRADGTFVMNGLITGTGHLTVGYTGSGGEIGTVRLNGANTFTGRFAAGRGNLILAHNDALGKSVNDNGTPGDPNDDIISRSNYTHNGHPNSLGFNMISTDDSRVIANNMNLSQWQTVKGEHSITFAGHFTQSNNRGIVNELPVGKTVTLSGNVHIYENIDGDVRRSLTFDGPGKTIITGTINDQTSGVVTGLDYGLRKRGNGVLVVDVAAGTHSTSGYTIVETGNLHFANNGSLNVSTDTKAKIRSVAGAVGVDVHPAGQTLATNTVFLGKIETGSVGGLMLSATDGATNLNFSTLGTAANMSLAAPETGITYTGTLTPNANQYRLGGGQGTLTLPNALGGAATSMSVRNGGTVRLLGTNTYGGSTIIEGKYSSTMQSEAIEGDTGRFLTPVLEVDDLANGGVSDVATPSSIGNSSNAAANLHIQGGILRYVGTGDNTDRLFTIGTHGSTIEASGTGPLAFTNSGNAVSADAANITATINDASANPNVLYNASTSRDVVIGMTLSDPSTTGAIIVDGCGPGGANCIPAEVDEDEDDPNNELVPVVVTGVSDNGKEIGFNASVPSGTLKVATPIVFGSIGRTLTLSGTNTGANVVSPLLSNSAGGGALAVTKKGTGHWYLEANNTNTGATLVEAGTLGGNGGVGGALTVNGGATFAPGTPGVANGVGDFSVGGAFLLDSTSILGIQLGGTGAPQYDKLNITGAATLRGVINLSTVAGFSPALGNQFTVLTATGGITDDGLTISGLTGFTKSIVGNSLILTKTAALSALAAVPEPASMTLIGMALAFLGFRRK
jgi:fibronectin-binding autotransporter adhesin